MREFPTNCRNIARALLQQALKPETLHELFGNSLQNMKLNTAFQFTALCSDKEY